MSSSRVNGSARVPSSGRLGWRAARSVSTSPSGHVVTVTRSGRSTAIARGAAGSSTLRTQSSSTLYAMLFSAFGTPRGEEKCQDAVS